MLNTCTISFSAGGGLRMCVWGWERGGCRHIDPYTFMKPGT